MTPEAERFLAWRNKRQEASKPKPRPVRPTRPTHRRKEPKLYSFRGMMLPVSEIALRLGLSRQSVHARIKKGTSLDLPDLLRMKNEERERLGLSPKAVGKRHLFCGQMLSVYEIAERAGVGLTAVYRHLKADTLGTLEARCSRVEKWKAQVATLETLGTDPDTPPPSFEFDPEMYSVCHDAPTNDELDNIVGGWSVDEGFD